MTQVFLLPDLGEGLTEAEIVEWLVAEGDTVVVDQHVVTVETAKAAVEVPCPYVGTVTSLHAAPGEQLAVGAPLITIGGDAEGDRAEQAERPLIGYGAGEAPVRRARTRRRGRAEVAAVTGGQVADTVEQVDTANGARAAAAETAVKVISPLVRRLAADAGVDLSVVTPTGNGGVIRRADVQAAALTSGAAPTAASATATRAGATSGQATTPPARPAPRHTGTSVRIPITGVRRAIADKVTTSRREIPDATTWVDVDATELVAVRDALQRTRPDDRIGVLALMARITVAALREHPVLNSSVDAAAGEIVQHADIHLGFAAQSPRGLVVPVVRGADGLSTAELALRLRELTAAAREGTVAPEDLTGGTFTLNNYGVFGVDGSTPIINHPEAAMLGVGRIVDKPWVVDGRLEVRKVTQLSFTFDHRVCDGGTAGGYLRFVADCVEQPAVLLASL